MTAATPNSTGTRSSSEARGWSSASGASGACRTEFPRPAPSSRPSTPRPGASFSGPEPSRTGTARSCRSFTPWPGKPRPGSSRSTGQALPDGARKLLDLARAVPPRPLVTSTEDDSLLARVGRPALAAWTTAGDALTFLGEAVLAFLALLRGRARFRRIDLLHAFEATGASALGIVALINFLIGAVLAFVGAVQLVQFGATIYVADLVAIGVTRSSGPS